MLDGNFVLTAFDLCAMVVHARREMPTHSSDLSCAILWKKSPMVPHIAVGLSFYSLWVFDTFAPPPSLLTYDWIIRDTSSRLFL